MKESIEVITSVQRRRHWTASEKAHIVHETYQPGTSVTATVLRPIKVFQWRRRLAAQGALSAVAANEEVVPASEYGALQQYNRELQRLAGQENDGERDLARRARPRAGKKLILRAPLLPPKDTQ